MEISEEGNAKKKKKIISFSLSMKDLFHNI